MPSLGSININAKPHATIMQEVFLPNIYSSLTLTMKFMMVVFHQMYKQEFASPLDSFWDHQ
jgi:hypothetical protein